MKKICFVSDAGSHHTKKWCQYFLDEGFKVSVISFTPNQIDGADVYFINTKTNVRGNDLGKIKYLFQAKKILKLINQIKPDIVNVHYATSYGAAVALSGYQGYILSVWGADVYDFPQKSILHRKLLEYSLSKADVLFSTSRAMAEETKKYTSKDIRVTPFGVDMNLFSPLKRTRKENDNSFVVGTVKSLTPKYGIDYFLRAVKEVVDTRPDIPVKAVIAGKGEYENEYKQLAKELEIDSKVSWLGFISQEEAAVTWANMDVAVVPSTLDSESFGVSAVEAEASGIPVIISDVPGLMEATTPNITSLVVPRCDSHEIANAIISLYDNPKKRKEMGLAGRAFSFEKYELNECFSRIKKLMMGYHKNNA